MTIGFVLMQNGKKVKRMANITVPIQVNLPDDWMEQIVNRLRNDPESEWVEIVRCKDCKHWHDAPTSDGYNSCEKDALIRHEDFFCAAAERKEGETG